MLDAVGGVAVLRRIQAATPASANAGQYANIVAETSSLREAHRDRGRHPAHGVRGRRRRGRDARPGAFDDVGSRREAVGRRRQRLVNGATFVLSESAVVDAVWGEGDRVLWAAGEGLLVVGPTGVGKTTMLVRSPPPVSASWNRCSTCRSRRRAGCCTWRATDRSRCSEPSPDCSALSTRTCSPSGSSSGRDRRRATLPAIPRHWRRWRGRPWRGLRRHRLVEGRRPRTRRRRGRRRAELGDAACAGRRHRRGRSPPPTQRAGRVVAPDARGRDRARPG